MSKSVTINNEVLTQWKKYLYEKIRALESISYLAPWFAILKYNLYKARECVYSTYVFDKQNIPVMALNIYRLYLIFLYVD